MPCLFAKTKCPFISKVSQEIYNPAIDLCCVHNSVFQAFEVTLEQRAGKVIHFMGKV